MKTVFWMMAAGALGTLARYGVGLACLNWLGARDFPLATLFVNVVGSFLLALIVSLVAHKVWAPELAMIVGTGFCGAFTTFSTLMVESEILLRRAPFWALASLFANLFLGFGAVVLARLVAQRLGGGLA